MALRAQFQMLTLDLNLWLHISSTPDFNLVQVLVQDLLYKKFAKSKEPFRRCSKMLNTIYKKQKIKLFDWLIFFITFYTIYF